MRLKTITDQDPKCRVINLYELSKDERIDWMELYKGKARPYRPPHELYDDQKDCLEKRLQRFRIRRPRQTHHGMWHG